VLEAIVVEAAEAEAAWSVEEEETWRLGVVLAL